MIAGTVPYQHAGTPAWLIPARLPLWYMEAIASMYTILASIGCGPHVSSSCGEEDTCASSYVTSTATCVGDPIRNILISICKHIDICILLGSATGGSPGGERNYYPVCVSPSISSIL